MSFHLTMAIPEHSATAVNAGLARYNNNQPAFTRPMVNRNGERFLGCSWQVSDEEYHRIVDAAHWGGALISVQPGESWTFPVVPVSWGLTEIMEGNDAE
jgi:hypothetical protein